jgi:hypothetical protein
MVYIQLGPAEYAEEIKKNSMIKELKLPCNRWWNIFRGVAGASNGMGSRKRDYMECHTVD